MQQIADWLEKLGMSEYAQRFAENGIDLSVLPDLTDQDLKDIGVLLGHRRKLLRAIAELNNAATTAAPAPSPVVSAPMLSPISAARVYLAQARWMLGEVEGAQELAEEASAQAFASDHIPTLINVAHFKALFEICQGDARAA